MVTNWCLRLLILDTKGRHEGSPNNRLHCLWVWFLIYDLSLWENVRKPIKLGFRSWEPFKADSVFQAPYLGCWILGAIWFYLLLCVAIWCYLLLFLTMSCYLLLFVTVWGPYLLLFVTICLLICCYFALFLGSHRWKFNNPLDWIESGFWSLHPEILMQPNHRREVLPRGGKHTRSW